MKSICITVLLALSASGVASAQKVTYQFDRGVDFSPFHTYRWVNVGENKDISPITAQNITGLINTQLSQKGLKMVAEGQPADLYVAFQASVSAVRQLYWYDSGGPWVGSMGSADVTTVETGTLVVDFYSSAVKRLVWRGVATKTLNPSSDANKNYEHLQKAVEKLLQHFPPSAKTTK
jgi:hypothetical protein